jgi:colicin import membrane protein
MLTYSLSRAHSRLTAAATSYVERYAKSFGTPIAPPIGWKVVVPQQPSFEFVKGDDGAFVCTLPWCYTFSVDTVYRFHNLPGAPAGLTFKIDASVVGKAFRVSVQSTITGGAFTTYNNLLEKVEAVVEEVAPTEVCEPVDLDALDNGEWESIDGKWNARRQGDGSYLVKLAADYHSRLVAGCDVRFTEADECEIAEVITRLPLVLDKEIVLDIPVNLSSDKDAERVSGLQVRRPPSVAVASVEKPPVAMETLESDLGALQFKRDCCARNGDCWMSAPQAGRELTLAQARCPSMDTLDDITTRRGAVCDLLLADEIGGMDGATVRRLEMIPEDALSDFRTQGFWDHPEEHLNAFMMLGLSIDLGRPILVFERRSDGQINADALLYGARDADGSLRRTTKDPITISSYTNLSYRDALSFLRTKPNVSVILYDRDARHFDPFVLTPPEGATAAPAERTMVDERAARERAAADAQAARAREKQEDKAAREKAKAEEVAAKAADRAAREKAKAEEREARERERQEEKAAREKAKAEEREAREQAKADAQAAREKAKAEEREAKAAQKAERERTKEEERAARERVRAAETAAKAAEREAQTAERLAKAQEAAARASERAAKAMTKRTQVPSQPKAMEKRAAPPPKSTPKRQKAVAAAPPPARLAPSRFGRKRSAPAAHVFEDDLSVAERVDRALKRRAPVLPPTIHGYSVPPHVIPGARVWAKALYVGQHSWFIARVIKLRAMHPRIHVRFEEDAQGNTHKHALPELDAYLFPSDVAPLA